MSFSASSEIFLLPLSVSLTTTDRKSAGRERPRELSGKPDASGTAPLVGSQSPALAEEGSLQGRLSLEACFLADEANSRLRVFDDLTCLDSINSPIVLYGPSQTGKSLLSRGVAQRLARIRAYRHYQETVLGMGEESSPGDTPSTVGLPNLGRSISLSASDWSRQLQEAIETNSIQEFRERFLSAGTVQIDDLTLLKNSPFSQGQLVILLDLLEEAGVPVLITSARHPNLLEDFRPDLISRLLGGMVLPVNLPGPAAKRTYLSERSNQIGLRLSADICTWIAEQAPLPTFAALEGFLQELSVRSRQSQSSPGLNEIKAHFRVASQSSHDGLPDLIIQAVAEFHELSSEQLKSPCRRQTTVLARGLAMSLIRHLCSLSLTSLGHLFGDRDHSTVLSALQTTERRVRTDQAIRSALIEIFERMKSKATLERIAMNHAELNVDLMFSENGEPDTI